MDKPLTLLESKKKDLELDLSGRDVILVEDIVDSGLTLSYVRKNLQARSPASLEVCALLVREGLQKHDPKLRYVGYVCEQEPYKSQDEMRNELQVENKLLVVTGGGGADAFPMMLECMKAFKLLGANSELEAIFITGPLMESGQREHLRELARGLKARVLVHVDDHLNYMNAADLVVTMGGYNSLYQLVRLRKKGLVIPRPGPSAEQQTRARLFSQRGLVDAIFPGELSPTRLADKLMGDLERTDYPIYDPEMDTDGSRKASDRLAEHLTAARISSPACYILKQSDTWHGTADASLDRTLRSGE